MSHGGKRSGAGRKSSYGGDKTVALRVPEPLKPVLEDWLRDYRSWRTANSAHADDVRTLARQLSELSLPLFANSVPAGSPVAADDLKEDDVDLNTRLAPRRAAPSWSRSGANPCWAPASMTATCWWWTARRKHAMARSSWRRSMAS